MFSFLKPQYIKFYSKGKNESGEDIEVEVTLPVNSFRLVEIPKEDKYFVEMLAHPIGWIISSKTHKSISKLLNIKSAL